MPIPQQTLQVFEMNALDRKVDWYANLKTPTASDLNCVIAEADVQCQLDKFRLKGITMDPQKLEGERHYSSRLAKNMERSSCPKPHDKCEAHAIISGGHKSAAAARAIAASYKMRVDDPRNGCWLPNQLEDRPLMPDWLKSAVPHRRIHRDSYYDWLGDEINYARVSSLESLLKQLKMMRMRMQTGKVRPEIAKGTGIE